MSTAKTFIPWHMKLVGFIHIYFLLAMVAAFTFKHWEICLRFFGNILILLFNIDGKGEDIKFPVSR